MMFGLSIFLSTIVLIHGAAIQSKFDLRKEKIADLGDNEAVYDYNDISKEENDILFDFDGVLETSQAVEILFDELLEAFEHNYETMKIPKEIDPNESTILVEDAEETLGVFTKKQISELELLSVRILPLVKEDVNETNGEINWKNYLEVIGMTYTRYEEILEYLEEEGDYTYEYEGDEEDDGTVVHYIDSTETTPEPESQTPTVADSDLITVQDVQPSPFFYIVINLSLIAILCSVFVIFYIRPSKPNYKALIVPI